jgi:hypothetical protein
MDPLTDLDTKAPGLEMRIHRVSPAPEIEDDVIARVPHEAAGITF